MSGLNVAEKVGLQLHEGSVKFERVTCSCSLNEVENILRDKFKSPRAVFAAWQVQSIIWGTYDRKLSLRGNVTPLPENWLECRIFNETAELHLKRVNENFVGRYVKDSDGNGNFYVDSFARFWGEKISAAEGYVNLLDRNRKLYMEIPCAENNFKWYGLLTRNYIESDEHTGLSGYSDYRFVAIEPAEEGANIG